MTLEDEIEAFSFAMRYERGMSANTCEAYGRDLRFFGEWLRGRGRASAAEVTRDDIALFLRGEREAGLKGSTRARRTAAIRMWLRYLKERRMVRENPSDLMDPPKKALALPRVLSEEEVAAMLDKVDGSEPLENCFEKIYASFI